MEDLITQFLNDIGEDPSREGLQKTPERFAKVLKELTVGYDQNLEELVNGAIDPAPSSDLVIVKDIPLYSLCEHHLLPFYGKAHIGYLPGKTIIGLSKIPRIVDMFAKRLQVQERLTTEIAEALESTLKPQGLGIVIEALHLCTAMRGVERPGTVMRTQTFLGELKTGASVREEFLNSLKN